MTLNDPFLENISFLYNVFRVKDTDASERSSDLLFTRRSFMKTKNARRNNFTLTMRFDMTLDPARSRLYRSKPESRQLFTIICAIADSFWGRWDLRTSNPELFC